MEDEIFRKRREEEARKKAAQARRKREERERRDAKKSSTDHRGGVSSAQKGGDDYAMTAFNSLPVIGRAAVNIQVRDARAAARNSGVSAVASMMPLPVVDAKVEANKAAAEALKRSLLMVDAVADALDADDTNVTSVGKRKADDSPGAEAGPDSKRLVIEGSDLPDQTAVEVAADPTAEEGVVVDDDAIAAAEDEEIEEDDDDEEDVVESTVVTDVPHPIIKKKAEGDVDEEAEPEDNVRLWEAGWKNRYYEKKFSVDESNTEFIREYVEFSFYCVCS